MKIPQPSGGKKQKKKIIYTVEECYCNFFFSFFHAAKYSVGKLSFNNITKFNG